MMSISALLSRLRRTPAPPATPATRQIEPRHWASEAILDEAVLEVAPDLSGFYEFDAGLPEGFVLHPHAEITLPAEGLPIRVDAGEIIGRVTAATPTENGISLTGRLSHDVAGQLGLFGSQLQGVSLRYFAELDHLRAQALDLLAAAPDSSVDHRAFRALRQLEVLCRSAGFKLQPWQRDILLDVILDEARRSPKAPASNAPADVEAWREASGLPARIRSSSTTDAWREDLRRIARETRWGTSAGRLAWAAFMAGAGPTATPWQGFEAGVRFAASYQAGGLEDDAPASV